jgi:YbbR domain-containing protein
MGKKLINRLTHNLIYKIVAVFLAIILWLVVVNIDDPIINDTVKNIPITVINEETISDQGKIYTITGETTAYVKVQGSRSYVDDLKTSDFVAVADFSSLLSIANAVSVSVDWEE